MSLPEPWLRGPLEGVDPALAPILRSFEMAAEDLAIATAGLTEDQLWARPAGGASVGFHMRHIAGSIDRLLTYAEGRQLNEQQMAVLRAEAESAGSQAEVMLELATALNAAAERVKAIPAASLAEARGVGRRQMPTTVIGLLIHVAEHTQRHVGQAVSTSKFVRAVSSAGSTESA